MATSSQIAEILREIGSTSSTKQKEQLVALHSDTPLFQRTIKAALDPYVNYYIHAIPAKLTSGGSEFDSKTWELLESLASRSITGNAARQAVADEYNRLNMASAHLLKCIITKDLRSGISDSIVNKAIKGLIPTFPYMRCCLPKDTKLAKFLWDEGVFSQEKADGMFTNINVSEDGVVLMSSRSGTQFPMESFADFAAQAAAVLKPGTQTHGELLVRKNGVIQDREIGNGILNSVITGGDSFADDEELVYMAWDQIPLSAVQAKGKYEVAYRARYAELKRQINEASTTGSIKMIETRIVHSLAEAYAHYGEMLAKDKEGTVIKNPSAIWRDGTSKDQVKLKLQFEIDLEIVGFEEGNGKNAATFGSILCRTSDGKLEVAVSGFKDKPQPGILTRSQIWEMRDDITGTIMTVRANDLMYPTAVKETYSLFSPRFVEFRKDKTVADTLERVIDQYKAAKQAGIGA